ncbi:hypothetical protein, partial [Escherichia coli]|uniref:protein YmgL n=1 Tax=Escherichia coli TaxID=562 RepID=UPI003AFB5E87
MEIKVQRPSLWMINTCLLYTSDAADDRISVDLGGRRIIKKKKNKQRERSKHRSEQQLI